MTRSGWNIPASIAVRKRPGRLHYGWAFSCIAGPLPAFHAQNARHPARRLESRRPGAVTPDSPGAAAGRDRHAFAEILVEAAPGVLVVAEDLAWFNVSELIAAIRRRHPRTSLVVLARRDTDAGDRSLSSGMALDGIVQKTVAGFLRLGSVVGEV